MPTVKSKYQGVDGVFYIVNPAGAVHSVEKAHARARLQKAGWRLANDGEIELYNESKIQRFDQPIAEPWTPEPLIEPELPEVAVEDRPLEATPQAAELAKEHGLDLAEIEGSGAEGRILVADVEKALAGGEEGK